MVKPKKQKKITEEKRAVAVDSDEDIYDDLMEKDPRGGGFTCNVCNGPMRYCFSSDQGDGSGCTCESGYLCQFKYPKAAGNFKHFSTKDACIEHIKGKHGDANSLRAFRTRM